MNNTPPGVAIVYHCIALYRKPVFDLLCGSTDVNYYVVADEKTNTHLLNILDASEDSAGKNISKKWIKVKNIWLSENILWQRNLIRLAFDNRFDHFILLGNFYFISTWLVAIIARLRGKKVYFWTHGVKKRETGLKRLLRIGFYNLANEVLLYGNRAKDLLLEMGFPEDKLHVIYNSLDFEGQTGELNKIKSEDIDSKRMALNISDSDKVIIVSGRITKIKKLDLLIDAIADLNKKGQHTYKLIVVGDGSYKEMMQARSHELSVAEHVIFYGACYEESELALLISMSDVFVVPGDIGLSAIHALTYGTPVVTHDDFTTQQPESEAIKEGINGSFYKSGSVDDMVEKIHYWSTNNRDDVFNQCRSVVSEFYTPTSQKRIIDKVILEGC